jgi:hypothetical protein
MGVPSFQVQCMMNQKHFCRLRAPPVLYRRRSHCCARRLRLSIICWGDHCIMEESVVEG